MKKLVVMLSSMALLASCNNAGSVNDNIKTFKEAQKADHDKGNLGYRLEGHANLTRKIGNNVYANFKIQGLRSEVVLDGVPATLAELNFGYLTSLRGATDLKFSNFELSENPGTAEESIIALANSEVKAYVERNVGYIDLTGISVTGAKAHGQPINESYGRKWKIDGLFPSQNPLDFTITEDMFETYVMPLFTFQKAGNKTKANLDMDYSGIENYYVALKLASYIGQKGLNPLDKDPAVQDEIARVKNFYKLEVGSLFSEDIHLTISFDFDAAGISKFSLYATGEFYPNGLDYEEDDELETIAIDADISFHSNGKKKLEGVKDPSSYLSIR